MLLSFVFTRVVRRLAQLGALSLPSLLPLAPAQAASLTFAPIGIDLPTPQRARAMTIANRGAQAVHLQLRVFHWRQVDGADVLEPATDLLVSPPAARVEAGSSYTVRVARLDDAPVAGERGYRLIIDELPAVPDESARASSVAMLLRTSMPVFVYSGKPAPRLSWHVRMTSGELQVQATNHGTGHARIAGLTIQPAQGDAVVLGKGLNGYVLAGSVRRFYFKLAPTVGQELAARLGGNAAATLTALSGDDHVQADVRVDAP